MPANDREVFQYLISNPETPGEIAQITYAIFANERQHWCELYNRQNNRGPTQDEIDHWISEITDWRFTQMRNEAIQFFDTAAREYLAEEIAAIRKEVFDDTVIKEVKAAGGFWRQFGLALITALLAPLIIGAIIVCALVYDRWYPTIRSISDQLAPPAAVAPASPTTPLPKSN